MTDVVDFCAKIFRGSLDAAVNECLASDGAMVSAEVFLRSAPFVKTGLWDVEATLRVKEELERPPPVPEPEPAKPVPEQPTAKEPETQPEQEFTEPIPELREEEQCQACHNRDCQDHIPFEKPVGQEPEKMDRCAVFDGAMIPQVLKDVFARIEDDAKFESICDAARVRCSLRNCILVLAT